MTDDVQHSGCGPAADRSGGERVLPSRVLLIDRSARLVKEWRETFAPFPEVEAIAGDYFQRQADAIVSPANSFGIMDGGLDLAIRNQLGYAVQAILQEVIVERHHGELPVGSAEIIETGDPRWKFLIAAPTMRVPEPVGFTLNAYLAFRAVLVAIKNFNRRAGRKEIDSVVCPGLATGVGGMSPTRCARQMRAAYQMMLQPPEIGNFDTIHAVHQALCMA